MKGIVYYTNNRCEERISLACQSLLKNTGFPIISISQYPMRFGKNIVVPFKSGKLSMFKQILIGLKNSDADIIFCCEHDVLYHSTHFAFKPEDPEVYYFNTNVWTLDADTGKALYYDDIGIKGRRMTSGLVAHKELLVKHYKKKIKLIEKHGWSHKKYGYAPGKTGVDNYDWKTYQSEFPNVDIKHDKNVTKGRFEISKFKRKNKIIDSWTLADSIPWWGKTQGRFDEFLRDAASS